MKKYLLSLLLLLCLMSTPVLADVSLSPYYGTIVISNNSTAASVVSVNVSGLNSTELIADHFLNSSADDVAILSGGSYIPFMPGYGSNPWIIYDASIGAYNTETVTAYMPLATAGEIRYFPDTSGMTVTDAANLEHSSNFTDSITGYFDTSSGADKHIVKKEKAFGVYVSDTVSGNITASIGSENQTSTRIYYSSTSDGEIYVSNAVYNTAWIAGTGTIDSATLSVGQTLIGGPSYYVFRGFLFFDTSDIPSYATITSATLSLYGAGDLSTTDVDIVVTNGQPACPNDPLVVADYEKSQYAGNGGSFNTAAFVLAYNNIALNATGLTYITKGGATKLALRSSEDIAGSAPADSEYVVFSTSETAGTTQDPKLTITYTVPSVSATGIASGEHTLTIQGDSPFVSMAADQTSPITPVSTNLTMNAALWQPESSTDPFDSIDANTISCNPDAGSTWSSLGYVFGGNPEDLVISHDALFNIGTNTDMSCEFWLYSDLAANNRLFYKGAQWLVQVPNGTNKAYLRLRQDAGNLASITSSVTILPSTWYQVVFERDGANLKVFINGVLDSGATVSTLGTGVNCDPDSVTNIYIASEGAIANWWEGTVGEFRFYRKALSASEVLQNYNATKSKYTTGSIYTYSTLASVPDNANDWTLCQYPAVVYMESTSMTIGGVSRGSWDWEYNSTFTDSTGNGNTATPNFRTTSSDADVSAYLASFTPVSEPEAPAFVVGAGADFITDNLTMSGNFTTGNVTLSYPGRAVIAALSTATATPQQMPETIIFSFVILAASLSVSALMRRSGSGSIFVKFVILLIGFGIAIALGVYDWWMLVILFILAMAAIYASNERSRA